MSVGLRIFLLAAALLAGAVVLTRIRKAKMQIEDSVFWVLSSLLFILLAAFPPLIYRLTEFFGVQSPANLLFLLVIALLFMKVFALSLKVSLLEEKLSSLAQTMALRERFREEEQQESLNRQNGGNHESEQ